MVKPINFGEKGERDVGFPVTTARIYDSQGADELVFLDITATEDGRNFLSDTLSGVARDCFIPLTVGGGIRSIEAIKDLLSSGADKISINTYAVENPLFITEAANRFGGQCIVVSIDAKKNELGIYEAFTHQGKKATGLDVVQWAKKVEKLGAGEILLTSIDREGTMSGYDLDLIKLVSEAVSIPVIANGGAGTRQHLVDAVKIANASAIAASSIFHFSDSNISQVKSFLDNAGIPIRSI